MPGEAGCVHVAVPTEEAPWIPDAVGTDVVHTVGYHPCCPCPVVLVHVVQTVDVRRVVVAAGIDDGAEEM